MAVVIETGFTLPEGKNARLLHPGVDLAYVMDDAGTTTIDSSIYSKENPYNGLTVDKYKPNSSTWTYTFNIFGGPLDVSCVCVGSSDMFTSGQTLILERFTGSWVEIARVTPVRDGPIMFLFDSINETELRLTGSGTAAPTIYNIMIGNALSFQQAFYSGYSPAKMNRKTEIIGNLSGTGELLGRSKRGTTLSGSYSWTHLKKAWVDANIDGVNGVIQSMEDGIGYLAWRPSIEPDVDYIMRAMPSEPRSMGLRDYYAFDIDAEVYRYE